MLYRVTYSDTGLMDVSPITFAKEINGEIAIASEVGYKKIGHKCDRVISTVVTKNIPFRGYNCLVPKLKSVYVYTKDIEGAEVWIPMMKEEFEATKTELREQFARMAM